MVAQRTSRMWSVVRVSSGNFLEMYDFMVFGYYAEAIGRTFFPTKNHFVSLMSALMTFGAGFLMRPLGAIVLGAYADRHGRRAGLLLTLTLMSVGILSIACVPGYATIGVLAPLLVVAGRLLQGFSAGMELGGVSVYLAEIATPGHKGFYVSWQSGSQQIAVMVAALVGVILSGSLSTDQMNAWGWRVPLLLGCAIVPLLFVLRRSLPETAAFSARTHRPSGAEIRVGTDPEEAVKGADCVITDTWVSMGDRNGARRHNLLKRYQVNARLMARAKPDAIFMHCLPAHRGEEVTDEVIDGPQSVVFDEAENRLHAQKGILTWCLEAAGR